jgi:hypothetical protein
MYQCWTSQRYIQIGTQKSTVHLAAWSPIWANRLYLPGLEWRVSRIPSIYRKKHSCSIQHIQELMDKVLQMEITSLLALSYLVHDSKYCKFAMDPVNPLVGGSSPVMESTQDFIAQWLLQLWYSTPAMVCLSMSSTMGLNLMQSTIK